MKRFTNTARVSKSQNRIGKENHVSNHDALDALVERLVDSGATRLIHLGTFRVVTHPKHKRFDFLSKKMVKTPARKTVKFSPSKSLILMLNPGKRKRAR